MSTVNVTAPPAAAKTPRARTTTESLAGATAASAADGPRRRPPLKQAVRNVGIVLDTAARVVLLGRDGVKL
ncbi:hypothetical protein OG500_21760 [Kitasatospora sp. NBC_01250]|uniref:hypothetical protein n=1 Tax=unclassified Kitasatospora TaxID=2633591 RepID=UPI002E167EBF|nr:MULTISPECIES: hypothetical protein [unclassified Kitasatospora]WSJ68681.1 hypothetical protein OG294_22605 [Kitasatospora sp. NBC_01302]